MKGRDVDAEAIDEIHAVVKRLEREAIVAVEKMVYAVTALVKRSY